MVRRSVSAALRFVTLFVVAVVEAGLVVALPWSNGIGAAEGQLPSRNGDRRRDAATRCPPSPRGRASRSASTHHNPPTA